MSGKFQGFLFKRSYYPKRNVMGLYIGQCGRITPGEAATTIIDSIHRASILNNGRQGEDDGVLEAAV